MNLSVSLTRRETVLGWCYLLLSISVLPVGFSILNFWLPKPLSPTALNLVYFGVNLVCVVGIFHKFLWQNGKTAVKRPWNTLRYALAGFLMYFLFFYLLTYFIEWLHPDFSNVNDAAIADLAREHRVLMYIATVYLVPISEETFYRGLVFCGLHEKGRKLAYIVSTLFFAAIHVMGYVGLYDGFTLFLCFIQYLPAGITLAWAYEKTDTIVAPILMHIAINQIGMSALR